MRIKILDVSEADMRKAEARFKNEVIVEDQEGQEGQEEKLYDLIFKDGCTISTHTDPVPQLFVYNHDVNAAIALFETDFSEVHII